MSLKKAELWVGTLLWVGIVAVHLNTAAAFLGTAPPFYAPVLVRRQGDLVPAKAACASVFTNAPSFSAYCHDRTARSIKKLTSHPMMTMTNAESESVRQAAEKPISQARFKETVQTLFEQIDMDGNGIIDMEEVQNLAGNFVLCII